MADRDPVAVLREAVCWIHDQGGHDLDGPEYRLSRAAMVALAELERRQGREARLEALVQRLAAKLQTMAVADMSRASAFELVEAARKELNDGK